MSRSQDVFSLGVEEEFQIVSAATGELVSGYDTLMSRETEDIHCHMKPEFMQCVVECVTDICPNVEAVRQQTMALRATATTMGKEHGLALIAAGTHPTGKWYHQRRTIDPRYGDLEEALQDVARSILIYALHVHVNVKDPDLRIAVMNQARTYLPHILALSANSPFWMGRYTGYMAFRPSIWAPFPLSGVPDPFASYADFDRFRALFLKVNSLGKTRRIWWDIRSHHKFPTLEFRIADMPTNHADTIAIVAFIQALVKTLLERTEAGLPLPVYPTPYITENRWRAAFGGLRGTLIDFAQEREIPTLVALNDIFDLVANAASELGTLRELNYLRSMLEPSYISSAERQIAAFQAHNVPSDVSRMLMEETLRDVDLTKTLPLAPVAAGGRDGIRWYWPFGHRKSA